MQTMHFQLFETFLKVGKGLYTYILTYTHIYNYNHVYIYIYMYIYIYYILYIYTPTHAHV